MSKNNSSAPSLAALKMVGRKPVSGVKRGKSSSETALVSRQKQRRQKHRQEHRQKNDDPDGNLGGVQSDQAENEDRKGGLRLHHGSDSDFLLVFGGFGFFEDRAANTAGSVDIAEDIIYGRYGYSGVDTDDLHQGHENTHQGVGKAKAFQQAPHGNADDDRDTDGTCDIDLDDNRGGMVEHIVEQVPDTAGVNYQHQKGKGD